MAEAFRQVDELEDRRVLVGPRIDEFVDRQPQYLVDDGRHRLDATRQIKVQRAAHLDRAVRQLRREGDVAFV